MVDVKRFVSHPPAEVEGVPAVLFGLSCILVLLRCWVKHHVVGSFSIDDYLVVATLMLFTVHFGILIKSAELGLGKLIVEVDPANYLKIALFAFINETIYVVETVVLKIAIMLQLLPLSVARPVCRSIIIGTATFYAVFALSEAIALIFQCTPVAYFWDPTKNGSCWSRSHYVIVFYIQTAVGAASDIILAVVPCYMVWSGTRFSVKIKLCLSFVLGLGTCCAAVNIVRFFYIESYASQADPTYDSWPLALWSTIEIGIGLIAVSMVTLRPLFRRIATVIQGSSKSPGSPNCRSDSERNHFMSSGHGTATAYTLKPRCILCVQQSCHLDHSEDLPEIECKQTIPTIMAIEKVNTYHESEDLTLAVYRDM